MLTNTLPSEYTFSTRRVRCPNCNARHGFAALIDNPGAGKCHACAIFIPPNPKPDHASGSILRTRQGSAINTRPYINRPSKASKDDCEVPASEVNQSFAYLLRCSYEFAERVGIMQYDGGLSPEQAEREAAKVATESSVIINTTAMEGITLLRRENPFAALLCQLTRPTILSEWHVGLSNDGGVLFWYVDHKGRYRNAKKIFYDADGWHRLRDDRHFPHFLYKGNPIPLYGEWQLPSKPRMAVLMVEAEKTAIILSGHLPNIIVVATGGSETLTEARASVLRGKNVSIFFDRDEAGTLGAERARGILLKVGAHPNIINPHKAWPNARDGYDAADAIYDEFILGIKHG